MAIKVILSLFSKIVNRFPTIQLGGKVCKTYKMHPLFMILTMNFTVHCL